VRRALAVLGAIGMVVAAVLIRQTIDSDESAGPAEGPAVVMCAQDLADTCAALGDGIEVRTAAAADTAEALADGTLPDDVGAWITTSSWLEVLAERSPGVLGDARALATAPTVVATAPGRYEAISDLCASRDIWACLGDAAGTDWADLGDGSHAEWRELKVGLTDPDSAVGLSGLASASAGFFGTTGFAVNDPAFAEFEAWLANLAAPSAAGDPDPALTLATRPGTYSAAGSVAAIASVFESRGVEQIPPDVDVAATIVVVAIGDRSLPDTTPARDSLLDTGWLHADDADLSPTLKPGVMAALHTLWRDVTR
jgi:hypothetical protein